MSAPRVLVFDFDGVILESAEIKTRAFARLFENHPEHVDAVVDLHLRHAGVSRYEKFRMIHRDILGLPLDARTERKLGEKFSAIALEEILACPFVPGAREFLAERHGREPLYVASGTPEEELRGICGHRELLGFFEAIYGTPAKKPEILRRIADESGARLDELVFIGDAMTDLEGAADAGTLFIGRVPAGTESPFPAAGSFPVVADLDELRRDWDAIAGELRPLSPAAIS
jgi:phosphoglycolate phosphatase-like HAD superfamily hydrolase